jgi:hypothetical protein
VSLALGMTAVFSMEHGLLELVQPGQAGTIGQQMEESCQRVGSAKQFLRLYHHIYQFAYALELLSSR